MGSRAQVKTINPAEKAYLYNPKPKFMGITFDIEKQRFQFDFEHDGTSDLVTLTGSGYQVEAFGKCFYYGYEFEPEIDSETRTKFIQYVKFSPSIQKDENLSHFIQKAINDLNSKINLYDYDLVIYPESTSQVNQYMLRILNQDNSITIFSLLGRKNLMAEMG